MKKKPISLPYRRKREGKTNYKKRLKLLLSGKPRLVIRPSLKNIIAQIIEYNPKGDQTITAVHSRELAKFDWKFSTGNITTAYLTGLLLGKKALKKNIKEAVLDIGLKTPIKGSKIFACLKGVVDAGVLVPVSEEILPSKERISGKHIADYKKLNEITKVFEEVKNKILKVE